MTRRAARAPDPATPEELFAGVPLGTAVLARVREALADAEPLDVRTSRSQVALRRRRGFAWLWRPDRYLERPGAAVVLSFALGRAATSPRLKQVSEVSRRHWMHHLEVEDLAEIDEEVVGWLREAAERAG
jgi:hypothetical protein